MKIIFEKLLVRLCCLLGFHNYQYTDVSTKKDIQNDKRIVQEWCANCSLHRKISVKYSFTWIALLFSFAFGLYLGITLGNLFTFIK